MKLHVSGLAVYDNLHFFISCDLSWTLQPCSIYEWSGYVVLQCTK